MRINQLIDGLRADLRLDSLDPDEDGIYSIVFDEGLAIEILVLGGNHLLIRSRLDELPADERESESVVFEYLRHNLAALREQIGTLSIDREADCIWLAETVAADQLRIQELLEILEGFVNSVAWWQRFTDFREGRSRRQQGGFDTNSAMFMIRP
ncbi:MAG: CesT family type III secretion system chaperone [Planctomycetota bacterium]